MRCYAIYRNRSETVSNINVCGRSWRLPPLTRNSSRQQIMLARWRKLDNPASGASADAEPGSSLGALPTRRSRRRPMPRPGRLPNTCSGNLNNRRPPRCSDRAASAIVVIATQSQYRLKNRRGGPSDDLRLEISEPRQDRLDSFAEPRVRHHGSQATDRGRSRRGSAAYA